MQVAVRFDRVGAQFTAGETITGAVIVDNPSSSTHSGIHLHVEGSIAIYPSVRGLGAFEPLVEHITPISLLSLNIQLSPKGEKIPAGEIELPFSFLLQSTHSKFPLLETYQGVYVSCLYHAYATVQHTFGKTQADPVNFLVVVPGQSQPTEAEMKEDRGVAFNISTETIRASKRLNGDRIPRFLIEGKFERKFNDIDIPLSGWLAIRECDIRVTSVELQLIRVESAAAPTGIAREATEIQNIQIGDGDVMRLLEIPVYMFFPRWYTSPTLKTGTIRVDFEVNVVVTLEDQNQITQNIPIKLYRSSANRQ